MVIFDLVIKNYFDEQERFLQTFLRD